ncbi:MAG TPA: hypothetical protein VLA34_04250 [Candidatus Krumholzibacterium sp.]|nr:hypothetical protein [Candidatus Krumholzibacterium sp.]
MRSFIPVFTVILLAAGGAMASAAESADIEGRYLGEPEPGMEARPFAPGMLASRPDNYIRTITFSPGGDEAYWPVIDTTDEYRRWIVHSRMKGGVWTEPAKAWFSEREYFDDVPCISPGGDMLVFLSGRPVVEGGKIDKERIWYMRRTGDGWSVPVALPGHINEAYSVHQQVSLDSGNGLYFGGEGPGGYGSLDICLSGYKDGEYLAPVNLGPVINTSEGEYAPCVSPDGSCLIFTRNIGDGWTLMISFRDGDRRWTPPVDLREHLDGFESSNLSGACITPDSKRLIFFSEKGDEGNAPYVISTTFIEELRAESTSPSH